MHLECLECLEVWKTSLMQNQIPVRLSFTADCLYRKHQSGYNFQKKKTKKKLTISHLNKQFIWARWIFVQWLFAPESWHYWTRYLLEKPIFHCRSYVVYCSNKARKVIRWNLGLNSFACNTVHTLVYNTSSSSSWPVLLMPEVSHISVANFFFFSTHHDLFLFLSYRTIVSWLSYSVSMLSLGQHVCSFSAVIAYLSCCVWCFGNVQNHPVSLKMCTSVLFAHRKSGKNTIKVWRHAA